MFEPLFSESVFSKGIFKPDVSPYGPELVTGADTATNWIPAGSNIVTQDGDAVKVDYVSSIAGAFVYLRQSSGTTSEDVKTDGTSYLYTAEIKLEPAARTAKIQVVTGAAYAMNDAFTNTDFEEVSCILTPTDVNPYVRLRDLGGPEIAYIRNQSLKEIL